MARKVPTQETFDRLCSHVNQVHAERLRRIKSDLEAAKKKSLTAHNEYQECIKQSERAKLSHEWSEVSRLENKSNLLRMKCAAARSREDTAQSRFSRAVWALHHGEGI
jgi:outer membrane murein-binding lipoprotein Lpp